jgi:hypothetical protein
MKSERIMLEAFLPEFSGLKSPAWAGLLAGPRIRAAESHEFLQMSDYRLDRDDYLDILDAAHDPAKQCSELAKSYCTMFGIHLARKLGIPHGLRFERYDADADRIVALIPIPAVCWILRRCGDKRHRSLEGIKPREFEPLWDLGPESDGNRSEGAEQCRRRLDPAAVGTLLRAFVDPSVERKGIATLAIDEAAHAFSSSIDPDKFRSAAVLRRREKYGQWYGRLPHAMTPSNR